jgi:hypothetical protein
VTIKSVKVSFDIKELKKPHYTYNYDSTLSVFENLCRGTVVVCQAGKTNSLSFGRVVELFDSAESSKDYRVRSLIGRVDSLALRQENKITESLANE